MSAWIRSLPKPIGLMSCCDLRGQHVVEACRTAEVMVPEEVSILGVDNDEPLCDITNPKLSSIAMNTKSAGYEAAVLLEKLMNGDEKPDGQKIIVDPICVITRQSSDVFRVENPDLARALHYIKQYSHRQIVVSDVVAAACISRRSLEDKFNKYLHRSVLSEIRRVRIERFAQMLLETNFSIPQIARELNFPSEENVGRYFEREKGMRPNAYRKKFNLG
jgi:LacI family transcriptional regulator